MSAVTVNAQLQEMLTKLETKLKREVQQRLESQRKVHAHLHGTGQALEERLLAEFDREYSELQGMVEEVQDRVDAWEPSIIKGLTENN